MKRVVAAAGLLALGILLWFFWPTADEAPAPVTAEPAAKPAPVEVAEPDAGPTWSHLTGDVLPAASAAHAKVILRGPQPRTIEADDHGHFDFGPLTAGQVWLSATNGDLASEVLGPIFINPSQPREVTLTLEPAATVTGSVVDALTRQPLPNAAILSGQGATRSDAAGRFTLKPVPKQTWLEVSAAGHLTRLEWLSLESVRAHDGMEISLEPMATVEGQVLQQTKPVERASVWAEAAGTGSRAGTLHGPVPSGADGGFHLETSGGLFRLAASLPDGTPVQGPVLRILPGEHRTGITLEAGESLGVDGHVKRAGEPLVGAVVTAIDARTQAVTSVSTTGALGAFRFTHVPVGQYLVQVRQSAFSQQAGPFEQTGEGQAWEVDVATGSTLAGRVDPPAAGVRVWLRTGAWAGQPMEAGTDANGHFKFDGVPAGVLQLEAEGEEGSAAARAKAGDDVVLKLERGLLVVTVTDEKGHPVSDYNLSLVPHSAGLVRRMPVLSPTGAFPVHLPKGPWRLSATAEGYADSAPQEIVVGAGRTDARVQLQRAVAVTGSVHDAVTGLPVRGARVLSSKLGMMRLSTPGSETVTDGNGEFVLPALPLPSLVEVRDGLHQNVAADVRTPGQRLELKMQPGTPPPPKDQFFEYQGIGMMLGVRGQSVSVEEVYEGSPAEAAGLRPGNLLVSVDGNPAPPPPQNAVKLIQGPAGTLVTVTVLRGGETLDFVVRRKQIAL